MQNNKIQFSKIIIILCIILGIAACISAIVFPISETVAISLIAAGGSLATTSVIWNLKKSQAENTLKIYLSAYERILDLKHKYNDESCNELEDKMLNKIDQTFDETIDDATSLIEKQEVQI